MSIYHRVGQVLKPYANHTGYSIIIEKGENTSKILTDFEIVTGKHSFTTVVTVVLF